MIVLIDNKQYRIQTNGLIHVLENSRNGGHCWKVLNKKTRYKEYFKAIQLSQ